MSPRNRTYLVGSSRSVELGATALAGGQANTEVRGLFEL